MVRHRGRSPRGERLVASVPHGHWKTLTLVAALRINGLTAPYVIDGAMDGPSFLAYVEQILAPTLRKGDIVFMDNLRTHKIDGVRQAVEAVGAKVRYLPAYSPDLNPIEMAFSKLKTALREGGRSHRDNADEADRQSSSRHLHPSSARTTFDMPDTRNDPYQVETALALGPCPVVRDCSDENGERYRSVRLASTPRLTVEDLVHA